MIKLFWKWLGFHVHDWSTWHMQGQIYIGPNQRIIGYWQTRKCKECLKEQIHKVR